MKKKTLALIGMALLAVGCRFAGQKVTMKDCTNCNPTFGTADIKAEQGKQFPIDVRAKNEGDLAPQ